MAVQKESQSRQILRFRGISASRGIAIGPAYLFRRSLLAGSDTSITPDEVPLQLERFDAAVAKGRSELEKIRKLAEQKVGTSASNIFEAQMMMVSDPFILDAIRSRIKVELKMPSYAVDREFSEQQMMLRSAEDAAMRERADDIEDIKQRLLRYLLDREKWLSRLERPSIILAEFLTPADAILFSRPSEDRNSTVLGYAIDGGGVTSHAAILARSLGIPAIVALHDASQQAQTGDMIILDGERGELIINPDPETLHGYTEERRIFALEGSAKRIETIERSISGARTTDGASVVIAMNLEFGSEVAVAEAERTSLLAGKKNRETNQRPAIGLGLVRTEHFLLLNDELPTEEEQNVLYQGLAERFAPKKITLRTFDVGGDKVLAGSYHEDNPFLGWRGIRISLDEPEIFLSQLRAVLRASSRKNVRIMFPMVTNLDELHRALAFVDKAKSELRGHGVAFDEEIPVGMMIEVPAAAMLAHAFAPHVDFFSIGTNDLTQYTLAVDRGNDLIAGLYQELHPAVLKLIQMTVAAGHQAGKPTSICGELGSYPLATPMLLGVGVDEISVSPGQVRSLATRVHALSKSECAELTTRVLASATSANEVKSEVLQFLNERQLLAPFSEVAPNPEIEKKLIAN